MRYMRLLYINLTLFWVRGDCHISLSSPQLIFSKLYENRKSYEFETLSLSITISWTHFCEVSSFQTQFPDRLTFLELSDLIKDPLNLSLHVCFESM